MTDLQQPETPVWYRVAREWDLYVDGDLTSVHVEHIRVEPVDGGDHDGEHRVEHYDTNGDLLETVTVPWSDVERVVPDDTEQVEKPDYINRD